MRRCPTTTTITPPPALERRHWLLAALALAVAPARATERLRYVGDAAFAPFESLDAQGRPQGFQIELLQALGLLIGADISVTLQAWPEAEASFRQGRADLTAMVQTTERQAWALFAHGHATPAIAVYRRSDADEPQDVTALVGLRVAVPDGAPMRETLRTWLSQLPGPFVTRASHEAVLAAVARGEADVALLPRAYADPLLTHGVAPGVVASALVLRVQTYAFAVPPGQEALRDRLQAGLHTLERNGQLEALRLRWLSSHRDQAQRHQLEQSLGRQTAWTWGVAGASALGLAALGALAVRRGRGLLAERQRRRQAEADLQRAHGLLERSFTLHPDPMLLIERKGGVVRDTNAALQNLLGVPARTLLGQPLGALAQHIDAQALAGLVHSLEEAGALDAVPLHLTRADGRLCRCLVSADRLDIGGTPHVFCIVRDMTATLEQDEALHRAYDALAQELAQARQALEDAVQRQAGAERSLQEFTRAVAHDLRTPLMAVQGFVGLLRERLQAGHLQEAETYTEHIQRAAQRMTAMVQALHQLAQVSSQPLRRQTVDMRQTAQDTWTLLCGAQPERTVEFRLQETLPIAQADPDLCAQVWQNLLHNAWKYSARVAQARVSVDSFRDNRGLWYRVTDNGAGFDMAKGGQLFQPFRRLHSAAQFEGSGIGLSLVRRIVDHHGGEIRLRSAPGVGTVAEFTLDPAPEEALRVH